MQIVARPAQVVAVVAHPEFQPHAVPHRHKAVKDPFIPHQPRHQHNCQHPCRHHHRQNPPQFPHRQQQQYRRRQQHRWLRQPRDPGQQPKPGPQSEPPRTSHPLRQTDQPAKPQHQQMRRPCPRRREIDPIGEENPRPRRPPRRAHAETPPRHQEQRNADQRVDQTVEYVDRENRRRRVDAKHPEEGRHNHRINGRHDRRKLIRNKRAAKSPPRHQRPRHVPRFPGMEVIRIHQVFEQTAVERHQRHPQGERDQHHPEQRPEQGRKGAPAVAIQLACSLQAASYAVRPPGVSPKPARRNTNVRQRTFFAAM